MGPAAFQLSGCLLLLEMLIELSPFSTHTHTSTSSSCSWRKAFSLCLLIANKVCRHGMSGGFTFLVFLPPSRLALTIFIHIDGSCASDRQKYAVCILENRLSSSPAWSSSWLVSFLRLNQTRWRWRSCWSGGQSCCYRPDNNHSGTLQTGDLLFSSASWISFLLFFVLLLFL